MFKMVRIYSMSVQKLTIILFLALGLVGLSLIAASFSNQLACEGQLLYSLFEPSSGELWGERVISQSFVAQRNDLSRISIMFLTYKRRNTHDVTLRLLEVPEDINNPLMGSEIFRVTFNAGAVPFQEWRSFTFPPIPDSAEKTYLISLQALESEPGNAIAVGGIFKDVYRPGLAFLGYAPLGADMTFQFCYELTLSQKYQIFFDQITRNRPALWGNAVFYWGSMFGYTLLLVGFFWRLIKLQ